MFKTEEELLAFFMDGGCMLDTETGLLYKGDVNLDGEFFGIFVYEPVQPEARASLDVALEYADRWNEYDAPGWRFSNLAAEAMAEPGRFMTE